jgi:hypothetical protein
MMPDTTKWIVFIFYHLLKSFEQFWRYTSPLFWIDKIKEIKTTQAN